MTQRPLDWFPVETKSIDQLGESLQEILRAMLSGAEKQTRPYFIHMLGIPGGGKSTIASELNERLKGRSPVFVGFDSIMEAIPEYQVAEDREAAFGLFEVPAREAGYTLLRSLIEQRSDILLDHGGSREDHVEMVRVAKERFGYYVAVVHVEIPLEVAKDRVRARFEAGGRHTPPHYLDERERSIAALRPAYAEVADELISFPNGESPLPDSALLPLDELAERLKAVDTGSLDTNS